MVIISSRLFLEQLVSHSKEGDGESTAEEQNEVNSQLVSKQENMSVTIM